MEHKGSEKACYKSFDMASKLKIGFRCSVCGKEFLTTLIATKESEYNDLLTTPEKRNIFARLLSETYLHSKENALNYIENVINVQE